MCPEQPFFPRSEESLNHDPESTGQPWAGSLSGKQSHKGRPRLFPGFCETRGRLLAGAETPGNGRSCPSRCPLAAPGAQGPEFRPRRRVTGGGFSMGHLHKSAPFPSWENTGPPAPGSSSIFGGQTLQTLLRASFPFARASHLTKGKIRKPHCHRV